MLDIRVRTHVDLRVEMEPCEKCREKCRLMERRCRWRKIIGLANRGELREV